MCKIKIKNVQNQSTYFAYLHYCIHKTKKEKKKNLLPDTLFIIINFNITGRVPAQNQISHVDTSQMENQPVEGTMVFWQVLYEDQLMYLITLLPLTLEFEISPSPSTSNRNTGLFLLLLLLLLRFILSFPFLLPPASMIAKTSSPFCFRNMKLELGICQLLCCTQRTLATTSKTIYQFFLSLKMSEALSEFAIAIAT